MSKTELQPPFGVFKIYRLPVRRNERLRAWDAADEYLLQQLSETPAIVDKPLLVNDSFGALALALYQYHPVSWSDSRISHQATLHNLQLNDFDTAGITLLQSMQAPSEPVEMALIKVPKSMALFEDQLLKLKPKLTAQSRIIVAGMVKAMPPSVWKLLEKIIGPTDTSLAYKKARLIEVSVDTQLPLLESPYPKKWSLEHSCFTIINQANVFSRDKLDIGTRFFLEHLPPSKGQSEIIDLGCGNGILGLMAAQHNPQATIHFVDESYMAITSAQENFRQLSPDLHRATFHACIDLSEFPTASYDLVLCNPPFHQQQTVGDSVAIGMFKGAASVLKPGGELWVVGNRHLAYHIKLARQFARVELIASNSKFVIYKATQQLNLKP
jgi:23S rRNA (guanine1835-N2)-methyltransferase